VNQKLIKTMIIVSVPNDDDRTVLQSDQVDLMTTVDTTQTANFGGEISGFVVTSSLRFSNNSSHTRELVMPMKISMTTPIVTSMATMMMIVPRAVQLAAPRRQQVYEMV
jgi:hypothetical protein